MPKVIAINGSPRKNANTVTLLQKTLDGAASTGAKTEMIHLVDLQYKGCISCFACKRKNMKHKDICALQDDLTPILEKVMDSDAVILGSPIYLGDVTALTRAFIERLGFVNVSYDGKKGNIFNGKINAAFIYTMNVPRPLSALFTYIYKLNTGILKKLNGKVKQLVCTDTWQFDDYSNYNTANFNVAKKEKARKDLFPKDCYKAYQIGAMISEK